MRDLDGELHQLEEDEHQGRADICDSWLDTVWVDYLPAPHFQRRYRTLLKGLRADYKEKQLLKQADTIHAFHALGGSSNQAGEVRSDLLRENVKAFGLTIDIDKLIAEADTDGSGLIDYAEFKDMFDATEDEKATQAAEAGSEVGHTFAPDAIDPNSFPEYLHFRSFGAGHSKSRRRSTRHPNATLRKSRRSSRRQSWLHSSTFEGPDSLAYSAASQLLEEGRAGGGAGPGGASEARQGGRRVKKSELLSPACGITVDTSQQTPRWRYTTQISPRGVRRRGQQKRFPKPKFCNISHLISTNLTTRNTAVLAAKEAQAAFVTQMEEKLKRRVALEDAKANRRAAQPHQPPPVIPPLASLSRCRGGQGYPGSGSDTASDGGADYHYTLDAAPASGGPQQQRSGAGGVGVVTVVGAAGKGNAGSSIGSSASQKQRPAGVRRPSSSAAVAPAPAGFGSSALAVPAGAGGGGGGCGGGWLPRCRLGVGPEWAVGLQPAIGRPQTCGAVWSGGQSKRCLATEARRQSRRLCGLPVAGRLSLTCS